MSGEDGASYQAESIIEERDSRGYQTGVEWDLNSDGQASEDLPSDIRVPFNPEKIDVVTRNMTVDLLLSRVRNGALDLQPDFQRRRGIWTDMRQSRLIESLLLRIPLPTLYAAEDHDENWAVVDGIQRMTAITRFIAPQLLSEEPLRLEGLEYLGDLYNGAAFDDLPGRLQTRLRESELVIHVIRAGTPEEVKFNIFARINTGGLPLSAQELRHALIPGPCRQLLISLADHQTFKDVTTHSVQDERMSDREMALRFYAFRSTDVSNYRAQDFDEFLRAAMRSMNNLSAVEVDELLADWNRALVSSWMIFGDHAFRKRYSMQESRRLPINKALFESVMVNLAKLTTQELFKLEKRSSQINSGLVKLMQNATFERSISQGTGDATKVRTRFREVESLLLRELRRAQ